METAILGLYRGSIGVYEVHVSARIMFFAAKRVLRTTPQGRPCPGAIFNQMPQMTRNSRTQPSSQIPMASNLGFKTHCFGFGFRRFMPSETQHMRRAFVKLQPLRASSKRK